MIDEAAYMPNKSMNHDKQEPRFARLLLAGYAQRSENKKRDQRKVAETPRDAKKTKQG